MNIVEISTDIKMDTMTLLKTILRVKCYEYNNLFPESFINLIIDFYIYGVNDEAYSQHLSHVDEKNYFKSRNTINNAKTFLKQKGVLIADNVNGEGDTLKVSPLYLPVGISIKDNSKLLFNINLSNDK